MLTLVVILKPFLVALLALIADRIFGEPRHHPLVWFGNAAMYIEKWLNPSQAGSVVSGATGVLLLVIPPVALVAFIDARLSLVMVPSILFDVAILWFVIGWQSLKEHARAISRPLLANDLALARQQLARIVSRDTREMSEDKIAGSTVESVLENGHDSLFASLFWYALFGPAGALMHRLVNTLDAMWGYRSERYERFGKFAARTDDVLGYLPARLTAFSYAMVGATKTAFQCWLGQAPLHGSPNAGVVMAAGAGAMETRIGGPTVYQGVLKDKPWLGAGSAALAVDIERAIALIESSLKLWLVFFLLMTQLRWILNG